MVYGGDKLENKGIGIRAVSVIIDTILAGAILFVLVGYIMTGSFQFHLQGTEALNLTGVFGLLFFLYFVILEAEKGQTIGKMITGIKVTKTDGSEIGYKESLIRNILRIVDGVALYLVGAIVIAVSEENQRVGDLAAGTVIRE